MYFLSDQAPEYDKKRMTVKDVLQLQLFVSDEASAIQWLKQQLTKKPQTDLPGYPPAVLERDWRLAETRKGYGAIRTTGAEFPALRRQGRSAQPVSQLPLFELQGTA